MDDLPLRGHFKLARQIDRRGAYAEVSVLIHRAPKQSVVLGCQLPSDTDFSAGAIFGVAHALELLPRVGVSSGPFRVEITEIGSMLVDSTEAFVAYAAARSVFTAFGLSVEPMTLDLVSRSVTIPSMTIPI